MVTMKASHERIKALTDVSLEKMKATNLKANPEETEYEVEHKEVPKDDATVETDESTEEAAWGSETGRRAPQKATGKAGCQKKLAAAHRGMTCYAGVAGHKGHCSQGNSRENVAP
jgi:hypothetical protein